MASEKQNPHDYTRLTALGVSARNSRESTRLLRDSETTKEAIQDRYPLWFDEQQFIMVLWVRGNNIVHTEMVMIRSGVANA